MKLSKICELPQISPLYVRECGNSEFEFRKFHTQQFSLKLTDTTKKVSNKVRLKTKN